MVEPTSKQRFLDSCHFKRPGDLMVLGEEFHLFWPETLKTWVAQGAPAEIAPAEADSFSSRGIYESFGLVDVRYLREVLSGLTSSESMHEDIHGVSVGSTAFLTSPAHDLHVLEEDDHSLTFSNAVGGVERILKQRPGNMPQVLEWPVKDWESWNRFQERLDPNSRERWPDDWPAYVETINSLTCPVGMDVGGFFGYPTQWMGTERLMYMFYDDPRLVEAMMDRILELELTMVDRVTRDIKVDFVLYWEDMAYKAGPMISPDMVSRFMVPRYQQLNGLLHSRGIDVMMMDSDGNVEPLIPLWIDVGINMLWPLEAAAGMDPVKLRREYGKDLILSGGIDKRALAKDRDAIRTEIMSKVPFLMEEGGYFPTPDHLVPPDVPYDNFCYYLESLIELSRGVEPARADG